MIKAKIVNRGNCMLCKKELTEDEGIFFCKECTGKMRDENNKRKKELENRFNASVQNLIDQKIWKEPSLWWKCERCGKLIPYMADFCHECADEMLGDSPKPFNPVESEE